MPHLLTLQGISKSYDGVAALRGVDLALEAGTIHALVGANGAGKSTLINVLAGIVQPDAGTISLTNTSVRFPHARAAHRAGIVTVHQEVDLFADLSLQENLGQLSGLPTRRLGMVDWPQLERRTRTAIAAIGESLPPWLPGSQLTPAQRQLVEIASAITQEARVLILDEPTSSLSLVEVDRLRAHLCRFRGRGAAILYVSHRLDEVFALADVVTVLRDGERVWHGPICATNTEQLIQHMVGASAERERSVPQIRPAQPSQGPLLRTEGLTAGDGSFVDITLAVHPGEILGLFGMVGAGRTEWGQGVFGLRPIAGGTVSVSGKMIAPSRPGQMMAQGLAYVPEDRLRQGLCRSLTVRLNAVLASLRELATGPWIRASSEARTTQQAITSLGIRLRSQLQPVGTLSGGNQQKVVLGRWLARSPDVLILDEPTRGVDVGAKQEIHALIRELAQSGKAIILISSELAEVQELSDRIAVFREGRLVATVASGQTSTEALAKLALPIDPKVKEAVGSPSAARQSLFTRMPWRECGLAFLLLLLVIVLQGTTGRFLQGNTLANLATDAAILGFVSLGAAIVIISGGIDVSLGAIMLLSAALAGRFWEQGLASPLVLLLAVGVGCGCGLLNATLSLLGRVHPLVVTLGTMSLYKGLTMRWLTQDVQIPIAARGWLTAEWLRLPLVAWLALAIFISAYLFLNHWPLGRATYALGSNPRAARRVGIRQATIWLVAFGLQGALAGLAGILSLARAGSLQPTSFQDKTLPAIAAAVVGGVAITGGHGSVAGVALGCCFLVLLEPACQFLGIHPYWQQSFVGMLILVAVSLDALWRRRLR